MRGLARFGSFSLQDIEEMTLREYNYHNKAYQLKQVDAVENMAQEAIFTARAKATDSKGRYLVNSVSDLFDRQKAEDAIFGKVIFEDDKRKQALREQALRMLRREGKR